MIERFLGLINTDETGSLSGSHIFLGFRILRSGSGGSGLGEAGTGGGVDKQALQRLELVGRHEGAHAGSSVTDQASEAVVVAHVLSGLQKLDKVVQVGREVEGGHVVLVELDDEEQVGEHVGDGAVESVPDGAERNSDQLVQAGEGLPAVAVDAAVVELDGDGRGRGELGLGGGAGLGEEGLDLLVGGAGAAGGRTRGTRRWRCLAERWTAALGR